MVSAALVMIAVLASVVITVFAFKALFTSPRWIVKSKLSMAGQFLKSVSILWESWFLFQPKEWSSLSFSRAWLAVSPGIQLPRDFFIEVEDTEQGLQVLKLSIIETFQPLWITGFAW